MVIVVLFLLTGCAQTQKVQPTPYRPQMSAQQRLSQDRMRSAAIASLKEDIADYDKRVAAYEAAQAKLKTGWQVTQIWLRM
jgi:outer membrane murein-binding lipoprotein Lpp